MAEHGKSLDEIYYYCSGINNSYLNTCSAGIIGPDDCGCKELGSQKQYCELGVSLRGEFGSKKKEIHSTRDFVSLIQIKLTDDSLRRPRSNIPDIQSLCYTVITQTIIDSTEARVQSLNPCSCPISTSSDVKL